LRTGCRPRRTGTYRSAVPIMQSVVHSIVLPASVGFPATSSGTPFRTPMSHCSP
jgi:hypothetical protein